jgi:hypothetical protein
MRRLVNAEYGTLSAAKPYRRVSSALLDNTHAAAELLDNAVVRDGLAEHRRKCYGVWFWKSTPSGYATAVIPDRLTPETLGFPR